MPGAFAACRPCGWGSPSARAAAANRPAASWRASSAVSVVTR
jgi:hypothetical protein